MPNEEVWGANRNMPEPDDEEEDDAEEEENPDEETAENEFEILLGKYWEALLARKI